MAYEVITLNLIPSGEVPVIHAAQYDKARPLMFALKLGDDDFDPSTYDLELQIRKVDNNIVTAAPASTLGNVVTFNSTEQMTACSGTNLGEIQITKDDLDIATLHFYLVVQRDVLAGGLTSQSEIHDLEEQIAAIVPEVIGDDYYNKEEVDEKIAEIPTFDPTNYYDKSDVDTLLSGKADVSDLPDMTNYYDKSETDALLDDKANVSDLPDMTDYYTKSEVDTKITDLYQIKTASGSLVHITDGGDDIPVKSFECEIGASGYTQADIVVSGKNLLDYNIWKSSPTTTTRATTVFQNNGVSVTATANDGYVYPSFRIPCVGGEVYTLSWNSETNIQGLVYIFFDDNTNVFIQNGTQKLTFTVPTGTNGVKLRFGVTTSGQTINYSNIQVELGNTATNFEEYNGNTYTVSFGSAFNDGALIYENGEWYIDVSGVITPITSSTRVKTISGENNIFSDTGDCEVSYFTEKSDGIAELIKAFM